MWIARDKSGRLHIFKLKPVRTSVCGDSFLDEFWDETNDGYNGDVPFYPKDYFEVDSNLFPNLKWEDEPIEVELIPKARGK